MTQNRSTCVLGTRKCDPQGNLAATTNCVTRHGRLTFQELCAAVGKRSDAMSRMTDGISEDLTLRLAIAVTELQRDTRIFEEACRRVGGVFVPLDTREISDSDLHQALMRVVSELGEDSSLLSRALSDGTIDEREADAIEAEIDETIQAALQLKARVRAKVRPTVVPQIGRRA
jgi:hypothetical protein